MFFFFADMYPCMNAFLNKLVCRHDLENHGEDVTTKSIDIPSIRLNSREDRERLRHSPKDFFENLFLQIH